MRTYNLPPYAPTLMESTRAIGYSLEAAIADLIDNSISAEATKIDIGFFPIGGEYIYILDDGIGMSSEEITNAMQYGSRDPNEVRDANDLGRYGLGLKTASLSQCRKLTVVSKKDDIITGRRWDLDHIKTSKSWSLLILDDEDIVELPGFDKLINMKQGTLVLWQNLDKLYIGETDYVISLGAKMKSVREHIALVFHRYLNGEQGLKKFNLLINDKKVEGADPFLIKKSTAIMDAEAINISGEEIIVRPYILPHISKLTQEEIKGLGGKEGIRKQQGFYVYRNKRLLVWGTWFKLIHQGELSKLARVQIDIPNSLDDLWVLDIKKSKATPPEEVRKNLAIVINKIADSSKRTWTYRGKKEVDDNKIHIWNRMKTRENGIIYEINRDYPLVDSIVTLHPKVKNSLYTLLNQIEGNIPLNSLYIDLTNDEKLSNDTIIDEKNAIKIVKSMLEECETFDMQFALYENLKNIEPFCEYLEEITNAFNNGELI